MLHFSSSCLLMHVSLLLDVQHTYATLFTQLPVHPTVYAPLPTAHAPSLFPELAPNSPSKPSPFLIPQLGTLCLCIYDFSPTLLFTSDNLNLTFKVGFQSVTILLTLVIRYRVVFSTAISVREILRLLLLLIYYYYYYYHRWSDVI